MLAYLWSNCDGMDGSARDVRINRGMLLWLMYVLCTVRHTT